MITPQTINPLTLPSVPLEMRSQLPTIPCIYFGIDSERVVQYIGRSINLQQRWIQHHRQHQLKNMSAVQITWLAVDTLDLLPEIEAALIEWFNPRLNQTKVVSNSNKVSTYVDQKLKGAKGGRNN